jgi:8-oxo-dGTP pyrophosphatase MutT (NUDIX family)
VFEDGHVLLNRITKMDYWFLLGGRIEVGDESEESSGREMREELGIAVRIGHLIWIVESFFEDEGRVFHELELYYSGALPAGSPYSDKATVHRGVTHGGDEVLFQWFPLRFLSGLDLVPPFLKTGLRNLPRHPQHLIDRE